MRSNLPQKAALRLRIDWKGIRQWSSLPIPVQGYLLRDKRGFSENLSSFQHLNWARRSVQDWGCILRGRLPGRWVETFLLKNPYREKEVFLYWHCPKRIHQEPSALRRSLKKK